MELHPLPLEVLLLRAFEELRARKAIYDLPQRKWWTPTADLDLSCVEAADV